MTNAQFDVLTQKLFDIEKRQIQFETIQAKQVELLTQVANNKLDVDNLREEIEKLRLAIESVKDEVEA